VEKTKLVGAGCIVGGGSFDGIAGVDQIDELDALDDTAVLHVETGDDADLEHSCFLARLRLQCNVILRHRRRGLRIDTPRAGKWPRTPATIYSMLQRPSAGSGWRPTISSC